MSVTFRQARHEDIESILRLLADDVFGATRDVISQPIDSAYEDAFASIQREPNQELVVGELDGRVVSTMQLSFLPGLSRGGAWRLLIEAVRVASEYRGQGIGEAMMSHALARGRDRGCRIAQLTTDKRRADAHRFYRRLGFEATHEGMKRSI